MNAWFGKESAGEVMAQALAQVLPRHGK